VVAHFGILARDSPAKIEMSQKNTLYTRPTRLPLNVDFEYG